MSILEKLLDNKINMSGRPRRITASSINTPTVVHVKRIESLRHEEAELSLSDFVHRTENELNGVNSIGEGSISQSGSTPALTTIISQLKRLQRSLRGLPPLISEGEIPGQAVDFSKNKKIKFDDEDSLSDGQPSNKRIKFSDNDNIDNVKVSLNDDQSKDNNENDMNVVKSDALENEKGTDKESNDLKQEPAISSDQQTEKKEKKHKEKKQKKDKKSKEEKRDSRDKHKIDKKK